MAQMKHVLQQIITLYPHDNITVYMESGDNESGRPGALFPGPDDNPNAGVFLIYDTQGKVHGAVSICRIAAVTITSAAYKTIEYLPAPTLMPIGCEVVCEEAIRQYLPVGTEKVGIKAGGQTVAGGKVKETPFGMIVTVGNTDSNPTFASACKVEVMTK